MAIKSKVSIQQKPSLENLMDKFLEPELSDALEKSLKENGLEVSEAEARRRIQVVDVSIPAPNLKAAPKDPGKRELTKLEEGSREAWQWISTRQLDRDGEILMPSGADWKDFMKAPTVLVNHDYSQLPVGSDIELQRYEKGILARTKYATTPRAQEVFTLKQEGHLRTQSVGFIPVEWVGADDKKFTALRDKLIAEWDEFKRVADKVRRVFTKWIIFEHSDVGIPSNPNALQIAVAKGLAIKPETLEGIGIKGVEFGSEDPVEPTTPGDPPPEPDEKFLEPVEVFEEVPVVEEITDTSGDDLVWVDDGSL